MLLFKLTVLFLYIDLIMLFNIDYIFNNIFKLYYRYSRSVIDFIKDIFN